MAEVTFNKERPPKPRWRRWLKVAAIVTPPSLFAWNCYDYTPRSDSPVVRFYGSIEPELELESDVRLSRTEESQGGFCPRYKQWVSHLNGELSVHRISPTQYEAELRVGVPRFSPFCDWVVRGAVVYVMVGEGWDSFRGTVYLVGPPLSPSLPPQRVDFTSERERKVRSPWVKSR